ncbi:MAG: FecR family protein, partial [Pseudolabrys sp.]
ATRAERLWDHLGPTLLRNGKKRGPTLTVLATMLVLGAAAIIGLYGSPIGLWADYATATGEIQTLTLADGSVVDMDTGTAFDVNGEQRTITLRSGQIHVQVAPDPVHPFSVISGDVKVQALGTGFAVRHDAARTLTIVTEHAVRISADGQQSDLHQGQAMEYVPDTGLGRAYSIDAAAATAWRHGELVFDRRPLGDVIMEVARYRRGRIVIRDDSLRRLLVTGNFELRDTDSFLESLQTALPISIMKLPGFVLISRDNSRTVGR